MRTFAWGAAAVLAAVSVLSAAAPPPAAPQGVEAVTRPSADVVLQFVRPGRIAEVRVRQGDAVKPGDLLTRLDDEAEQVQLAQLKAQAEDLIRIKAADAQTAQKREDLKKIEGAASQGAATPWEVEHARLEVLISELSADLARFTQKQDRLKYEEAVAQVARMKLTSPVAGTVELVLVEEGEPADPQTKAFRLVKTDVLWADVPVPMAEAVGLKAGAAAQVLFPGAEEKPVAAKILFLAAVADAASETRIVRLEIPNAAGRPAGERVRVRFPAAAR